LGHGRPGFPQGFSCPAVLRCKIKSQKSFAYRIVTFYDWPFQDHSTKFLVCHSLQRVRPPPISTCNTPTTTPVCLHSQGLGMFPVRSPLLGESLFCFLFLEVLRWFTSLGLPPHTYVFSVGSSGVNPTGLPHSDICGSMSARDSPQLFAACHVLLRL
jgi:hypothetical protein